MDEVVTAGVPSMMALDSGGAARDNGAAARGDPVAAVSIG
jgi:hypothetical protein